jgi:hypothetical protein
MKVQKKPLIPDVQITQNIEKIENLKRNKLVTSLNLHYIKF